MNVYTNIETLPNFHNTVITIGSFDGVHKGHQKILNVMSKYAAKTEGDCVLITFYPHPRSIVQPKVEFEVLNTYKEKIKYLSDFGLNNMVVIPFDVSFSEMSPDTYIQEFIYKNFNPKTIVIGYDHRFGKGRQGSIETFRKYEETFGYEIIEIQAAMIEEITISSTKIRTALKAGDIQRANELLGYNYPLQGIVSKGKQLGRTIGFPTANLTIEDTQKLIPQNGVYIVLIFVEGSIHQGLLNIGNRPTLDNAGLSIEAHIFNFNKDIYGKEIRVELLYKIRNEQKFDGLEALKNQILVDQETAKSYFEKL